MQYLFFTGFAGIAFGISIIFFYISSQSEERYVKYLGICWLLYTGSLLLLTLGIILENTFFMQLRCILDIFNLPCLLYSAYAFASRKAPGMWMRFAFYVSIWIVVAIIYKLDSLSITLPASFYQIVLTFILVFTVHKYWNTGLFQKLVTTGIFLIWGLGKSLLNIISLYGLDLHIKQFYVMEVLFSNLLCFIILILYFQRSQEKLDAVEKITHTITENATDVLFLYADSANPAFSYITPSVNNLLGVGQDAFYANYQLFRDYLDPDDVEAFEELLSFKGDEEKKATVCMYDKDSRKHWCEVSTKLIDEEYEPLKIEGIIHDVTDSIDAHNQLLKSKEERDILLSYVSHELKTPLTSILGYVTALKDGAVKDEQKQQDMLEVIYSKTLTLDKLIFDLVQLSKLETHQFPLDLSLVSCQDMANELIRTHIHDGDEKNVSLKIHMDDSIGDYSLIADMARIDQVFTNLMSNALRFTEEGGKILARFDLDTKQSCFVFSVTNFGEIIPTENLKHIFDRFYRVNKGQASANQRSSGLGLTISKELVLAHHGNITAESSVERGTTFTVSLPLFDDKMI